MLYTAPYHATIVTNPPGILVNGNSEYLMGTDLNLTCMVTPTPPANSTFSWSCSTGCFADMKTEQTIHVTDLDTLDNGIITCSVTIRYLKRHSEPLDLLVSG